MNIAILILSALGMIVALVGSIMLLVAAFRVHVGWGLASLFVPLAGLVFIARYWSESRRGFFISLAGVVLLGSVAVMVSMNSQAELKNAMDMAFENVSTPAPIADPVAAQAADLDGVFAELKQRHAALEAQRTTLNLSDAAAVTTFNEAASAYHRDLHQARAEKAALTSGATVAGNAR